MKTKLVILAAIAASAFPLQSRAAVIADLDADFAEPVFPTGWRYQWNANGAFDPLNLTDLVHGTSPFYSPFLIGQPGTAPAGWLSVWRYSPVGGIALHPGAGATQPYNLGFERFAAVSYEVQPGEAGPAEVAGLQLYQYELGDNRSDGVSVQLFKIQSGIASSVYYQSGILTTTPFTVPSVDLGYLNIGDRVVLAIGAGPADYFDSTRVLFQVQTVPEPSSVALLCAGILSLVALRRRNASPSKP